MNESWIAQGRRALVRCEAYRRQALRAKRRGETAMWRLRTRQAARAMREFVATDPGFSRVADEVRAIIGEKTGVRH